MAAVHAQTGCLSSWPELASPDREGVRRVGQMGGQRVEGLSGAAWSCCFGGRAALGLLVAHSPAGHVAERGDCVGWWTVCSCSSRKSAKSERRARRGLLVTSFVSRGLVTARVAEVRAHARHPSRPSPRTTLSERECQRPHLHHEPRAAPAASPPAPALFAVLAAAPRGTESSFS